jgi:hypothetical protein
MPISSRRTLLKWALGAGQLSLLDRYGLLSGRAHAASAAAPSRLVVMYVPGGFRPQYMFWGQSDADVERAVPPPGDFNGEAVFFRANQLVDLGPANGSYRPLRTWRSWDPNDPSARGKGFSPAMYGYVHFKLHEQMSVLHGIDQGTNDHGSGFIASMCGVAGADFRAPAIHSVLANHLFEKYRNTRPLPCVVVTSERGTPVAMGLPSRAAPVRVPSIDALKPQLSDKPMDNPWWTDLNARTMRPETDVRGKALASSLRTTTLEEYSLTRPRKYLGRSTGRVDQFLESLHGSLQSVSRVLATDVVSTLERTKGTDLLKTAPPPYLKSYGLGPFGYTFGLANFHQTQLEARMDMALRLVKADLATSVHVSLAQDFDTHNGIGNQFSCAHGRNIADCIARFLGEMKSAPAPGKPGKTLLDDTLVLVLSEFGRSWASQNAGGYYTPDDHHPFTSVFFIGGGVAPNRQIGMYDVKGGLGTPVDIIEENGQPGNRVPRAADVTTTALRILGLEFHDFFIPGGYGEVVGMRA